MLKNYKPATYKTVVEHQLVFLDSENGGYAFPCDANGNLLELWDQYYGACRCPKCGKWYNLFGQSLLSPDYWEMDPSEEEYYEEW